MAAAVLLAAYGASPAWAQDLTVTNNADSGAGTLREAVATANSNGEADTITFDLAQGQRTITLNGQITFTAPDQTTVDGGEQGVTVSGGNATRVFFVDRGGNLAIKRLTVSDGNASDFIGGGILEAAPIG